MCARVSTHDVLTCGLLALLVKTNIRRIHAGSQIHAADRGDVMPAAVGARAAAAQGIVDICPCAGASSVVLVVQWMVRLVHVIGSNTHVTNNGDWEDRAILQLLWLVDGEAIFYQHRLKIK